MTAPPQAPPEPLRRYRQPRIAVLAPGIALVLGVPFVLGFPQLLPLALVPVAFALWVLRSETRVDRAGLTVTGLVTRRRVPWEQVDTIEVRRRVGLVGPVRVHLVPGAGRRRLDLPNVRRVDLSDLRAAAEGRELSRLLPRS